MPALNRHSADLAVEKGWGTTPASEQCNLLPRGGPDASAASRFTALHEPTTRTPKLPQNTTNVTSSEILHEATAADYRAVHRVAFLCFPGV